MAELVVNLPEVKLDEPTLSELKEDIRSIVRLRLARGLILKRLDKILKGSTLTDEECLLLGDKSKESIIKEWKKKGWL